MPKYSVPSANHGSTTPLSPEQRKKRRAREDQELPLALTMRDGIQPDPDRKIPARATPHLILSSNGTPAMSHGFENLLCGPKPRALLMALRRLQRMDSTTYDHLVAYFVHEKSERQIALESSPPISRWQVASSIKWGVGFLAGIAACDDSHAQLRGVTVDDLYQDADLTDDDDDDDGQEAADVVCVSSGSVPGLSAAGLAPSTPVSPRSRSTSSSHGAAAR